MTTTRTSKKPAAPSTAIAEVHLVPLDLIDVDAQTRTEFDEESIAELAADIAERGLLQPILLNPTKGRFRLIAGERRLRATRHNQQTAIPAIITKANTQDALLMQLAENIHREELTLQDEANAIKLLHSQLDSLDAVAQKVKKSNAWCSKRY